MNIQHPLPLNTKITGKKPSCPCRGAKFMNFSGKVLKIINNNSGIWYYIDSGSTVKSDWIENVTQ